MTEFSLLYIIIVFTITERFNQYKNGIDSVSSQWFVLWHIQPHVSNTSGPVGTFTS